MKIVTLAAKGPSLESVDSYLHRCPESHVACINDSYNWITSRDSFEFCFFTHPNFLEDFIRNRDRIDQFIGPDLRHESSAIPTEIADKTIQYSDRYCAGDTYSLIHRIERGGITHHNTVNGALHWLCKYGKYDLIRIIGVDGGSTYVGGGEAIAPLDEWKQVTKTLCGILSRVYGTKVEWYES